MYKGKTFLAIIPARSGSKGIPDKNIRMLCNKPLMAYTIEASLKIDVFDDIIVSTDSQSYADIAKTYGIEVPYLRPSFLANDEATTCDVIIHVLQAQKNLGKEYDYFMLLQPTSPLRNEKHIIESIELLLEKKANSVVSVCQETHARNLSIPFNLEGKLEGALIDHGNTRRQDQEMWVRLNGAIYLCNTQYYWQYKSFYKDKSYFYKMDEKTSIDIDTIDQFEFTEWLMLKHLG